jgi:hypothetical protein
VKPDTRKAGGASKAGESFDTGHHQIKNMTDQEIYTHWTNLAENPDAEMVSVHELLNFAKRISDKTNDRACRIIFGLCVSDNNAQKIVDAIRKNKNG